MRYLIDEGALPTLTGCEPLAPVLQRLAHTILDLRRSGEIVGLTGGWASIPVMDTDLGGFLTDVSATERDAAQLTMLALDRCQVWDGDPGIEVDPYVAVDGDPWESFAVAHAADLITVGRVAGCVTVQNCHSAGVHEVTCADRPPAQVAFLVDASDTRIVHRQRFAVEDVAERDFFEVAADAFPNLVFSDVITFRRFDGRFETLRDAVVSHLAALNDGFHRVYTAKGGDLKAVSTELGVPMSIEGGTRSSPKLMKQRDAVFRGRAYRCEIHTKIEPHRNRIHFHPGDDYSGGRLVVGIFVDHLDT